MTMFQAKLIAIIYLVVCIMAFILGFYYLGQYLESKDKRDLVQCTMWYISGTLEIIMVIMMILYKGGV